MIPIAITVGKHNLSAGLIIFLVILICVAVYFVWQRRRNQQDGHDK